MFNTDLCWSKVICMMFLGKRYFFVWGMYASNQPPDLFLVSQKIQSPVPGERFLCGFIGFAYKKTSQIKPSKSNCPAPPKILECRDSSVLFSVFINRIPFLLNDLSWSHVFISGLGAVNNKIKLHRTRLMPWCDGRLVGDSVHQVVASKINPCEKLL